MLGVMATKKGTQGFHAIVPYTVLILDNWLESSIKVRITRKFCLDIQVYGYSIGQVVYEGG